MPAAEEELLLNAAQDGSMDVSQWPSVLEDVLKRLKKIVTTEFPFPAQAPSVAIAPHRDLALGATTSRSAEAHSWTGDNSNVEQSVEDADKENTSPSMPPPATPARRAASTLSDFPDLEAQYQSIVRSLRQKFSTAPPYTVQRLAELILEPRRHYRHLPPFLNAFTRVVSVSSSTTNFPLPPQALPNGGPHLNGDRESAINAGGDEGLGGALLTPIPWLRHGHHSDEPGMSDGELHTEGLETIDGPNGMGSIETVSVTMMNGNHSVGHNHNHANGLLNGHHDTNGMTTEQELREQGAVTQGELLRQEQEAGVIPVTQVAARRGLAGSRSGGMGPDMDAPMADADDEEIPHARGPEEIGMEDLGPQGGELGAGRPLDLEAALGQVVSPPNGIESARSARRNQQEDDGDVAEHIETVGAS